MFLDPRGITRLQDALRESKLRYAITGSLAAQRWAAVSAPRLAQVYVEQDPGAAAIALGLVAAESGANVQLIRPKDKAILSDSERADDGLSYATPPQVAADLLTSPGRGPAEGEELLSWMATGEKARRAGP